MTDKKLIIRYAIMAVVGDRPIPRYMGAEMCCGDIDDLLGWMIVLASQPGDNPRVELRTFSDIGPSVAGVISFCPFCGAKIELRRVKV